MTLEEAPTKEIDGITFKYYPMLLKPSRALFDGLAQRFGPAIASAVEGLSDAQIDSDMGLGEMIGGVTQSAGGLLRGVVAGLDPAYHEKIANQLCGQVEYQKPEGGFVKLEPAVREVMFACKLLTEAKLIGWCLSVQYADFLEPLRTGAVSAMTFRGITASVLESRKGSTGSSIESPLVTSLETA